MCCAWSPSRFMTQWQFCKCERFNFQHLYPPIAAFSHVMLARISFTVVVRVQSHITAFRFHLPDLTHPLRYSVTPIAPLAKSAMSDPGTPCSITVEDTFGPTVASSCLTGFDFTLLFEESVFTILPLGIARALLSLSTSSGNFC